MGNMKKSSLLLAVLMAASVTLGACAKKETTYTRAELLDAITAQYKEMQPEHPMTDEQRKQMDEKLAQAMVIADAAKTAKFGDSEQIKKVMQFEQIQALADTYLMSQMNAYKPSDADAKSFYDEQVSQTKLAQSFAGKSMHVRHILVETEAQAAAIIAKINAGEKFEALVGESKDKGSAAKGGDIGWAPLDQLEPAFSEAASKLKVNELTQAPVKTNFGYHIIQALEPMRTQKVPAAPAQTLPPFEAIKPQVIEALKKKHLTELKEGYKKTADELLAKEAAAAVKK
jgi:peptidyl-prolyl cis-trans isomerase C